MKKSLLVSSLFALFSLPLWGAEQTVTLDVPGMTCAACPITVKTALNRVEGVRQVDVSFERREARGRLLEICAATLRTSPMRGTTRNAPLHR